MYEYNSTRYKSWREKVYARDKYTCRLCGHKGTLNAHHIKRKVDFPELAHITSNGITLCIKCHDIITRHETLFESLFTKLLKQTLTTDFIKEFFKCLTEEHKDLVRKFKYTDRWLKIPTTLLTSPEYTHGKSRTGTGTRTAGSHKIKHKKRKASRKSRTTP